MRSPRISTTDPRKMTPSVLNKELDRLEAQRAALVREFIRVGRGHETAEQTMNKSDPLALTWQAVYYRMRILKDEIRRRYGPNAPHRLPRGF